MKKGSDYISKKQYPDPKVDLRLYNEALNKEYPNHITTITLKYNFDILIRMLSEDMNLTFSQIDSVRKFFHSNQETMSLDDILNAEWK